MSTSNVSANNGGPPRLTTSIVDHRGSAPDPPEDGEVEQQEQQLHQQQQHQHEQSRSSDLKERVEYDGEDDDDEEDEKTDEDQENSSPEDEASSTENDRSEELKKEKTGSTSEIFRIEPSNMSKMGEGSGNPEDDNEDDPKEVDDAEDEIEKYKKNDNKHKFDVDVEEKAKQSTMAASKKSSKLDKSEHGKDHEPPPPPPKRHELNFVPTSSKEALTFSASSAPTVTVRETFLSDSLTEEERRTRTRYIPMVEGMHALRKHEIKQDLQLARALPGVPVNNTNSKGIKSKHRGTSHRDRDSPFDDATMEDVENDDACDSNNTKDSNNSDQVDNDHRSVPDCKSGKTIHISGTLEVTIPNEAFRALPLGDSPDTDMGAHTSGDTIGRKRRPPGEVDSIAAFNPPRLPESVAAKKKHRMLRWQRRPADMDVDLNNYRKAVQNMREELRRVQIEYQRIQTIDNHLRRHFLQHIQCLNEEMAFVNKELATEQHKCLKATEWYLPTSRTRGRNDGRTGSRAMRDIFHGLRRLDVELRNKRELLQMAHNENKDQSSGIGGVSGQSFSEWQRTTTVEPTKFASAWVVPNDIVTLPKFGGIKGKVLQFFPYVPLNVREEPSSLLFPKKPSFPNKRSMRIDAPYSSSLMGVGQEYRPNPFTSKASLAKKAKAAQKRQEDLHPFGLLLCPRFAVQLPFGIGFFSVDSVVSDEDPSSYTNDRLAERWKGLIETASAVAPTLDIGAMVSKTASEVTSALHEYERALNSDDTREPPRIDASAGRKPEIRRLVPFGASMLPTSVARGTLLEKSTLSDLHKCSNKLFYRGKGFLGNRENVGVTPEVRELEDQNQEYLNLQAKVLQLRNRLYRQRRVRILNERTFNATKERGVRVESLVNEMRTDLKMLKGRLDDEIRELGISEETAERILTSYYRSLDFHNTITENPPSNKRRRGGPIDEDEVPAAPDKAKVDARH